MIRGAVLGGDVSKSRSPAIHQAAYAALGIQGEYRAISVDSARFRQLVRTLATDQFRYLNVTIPHKQAAAKLATSQSPVVRRAGASNTLIFRGSGQGTSAAKKIRAENTDGHGLLAALGDLGAEVSGGITLVIGAGGAAAGAVEAITAAGGRVRILARRTAAARATVRHLTLSQQRRTTVVAWREGVLAEAVEGAGIVVSAIPAAAWAAVDQTAGLERLKRGTAVLEMAYGAPSPLAAAVKRRTARYADGLGMLVHQAARAIELALGEKPPLPPLFRAARRG